MKVVTFGEVLLRFSKENHLRLSQGNVMAANYGGSEANAAVSLSMLGNEVRYVTSLPDSMLGRSCQAKLREMGLDTRFIHWGGQRIGTYYFEDAASLRRPRMVYDRQGSSFSELRPGLIPWHDVFRGADVFHCSGITCAVSESAAEATMEAVRTADEMGLTIACDINYRKNLWNYRHEGKERQELAACTLPKLMSYSDIIFGDEGEWELTSGLPRVAYEAQTADYPVDVAGYEKMFQQIATMFPRCRKFIIGLRTEPASNHHLLTGVLYNRENIFRAPIYDINPVVDPMGVGDAYLSAYLHAALNLRMDNQQSLNFSTAAAALKSTISGDFNLSTEEEILACETLPNQFS